MVFLVCFSIRGVKKKKLDKCDGDFFALRLVPVFSVSDRLYCTLNGCKSLVFIQSFQNRVCILGVYVKCRSSLSFCFHTWKHYFCTMSFCDCQPVFVQSCVSFMCVCEMMGECVHVHACAHVLLYSCFFCLVLTGHMSGLGGGLKKTKTKHSCCLVTSLWLHIIYYTFLLLCQTLTKYDILSLLVSLCIIQSTMPYLARFLLLFFCIDVLLHLHIGTWYHVCVQFVLCLYAYTALVMCILFKSQQ